MAPKAGPKLGFLDLPRELRDHIYFFATRNTIRGVKGMRRNRSAIATNSRFIALNCQIAAEYREVAGTGGSSINLYHLTYCRDFLDWNRLPAFPRGTGEISVYMKYDVHYHRQICGCVHLPADQRHTTGCLTSVEHRISWNLGLHRRLIRRAIRSAPQVSSAVIEFNPIGFPCHCTSIFQHNTRSGPKELRSIAQILNAMLMRLVGLVFPADYTPGWESCWLSEYLCAHCKAIRDPLDTAYREFYIPSASRELLITKSGWGVWLPKTVCKRSAARSRSNKGAASGVLQYKADWNLLERRQDSEHEQERGDLLDDLRIDKHEQNESELESILLDLHAHAEWWVPWALYEWQPLREFLILLVMLIRSTAPVALCFWLFVTIWRLCCSWLA